MKFRNGLVLHIPVPLNNDCAMQLLSIFSTHSIPVENSDVFLRRPKGADYREWIRLREESRDFLSVWEPRWPCDDLTRIGFKRRLKSWSSQWQDGRGKIFFVCHATNGKILGGINLTKIRHGMSGSATLGYWMGKPYAGKGFMKKAVQGILTHAFFDLNLNRIEAACLPHNERSKKLLQSSGFVEEGYARQYLEINGVREDHLLFAILKSDFERLTN